MSLSFKSNIKNTLLKIDSIRIGFHQTFVLAVFKKNQQYCLQSFEKGSGFTETYFSIFESIDLFLFACFYSKFLNLAPFRRINANMARAGLSLVVLAILANSINAQQCGLTNPPINCRCYGLNIDCSAQSNGTTISSIPVLPAGTVQFTAVNQSISNIDASSFVNCLTNLTTINLNGNRVENATDTNFAGLTRLTTLELNQNALDSFTFSTGIPTLQVLKLNNNRLGNSVDLSKHSSLTNVDVSNNQIMTLNLPAKLMILNIANNILPSGVPADVSLSAKTLTSLTMDSVILDGFDGNTFTQPMISLSQISANTCNMKSLSADFFKNTPVLAYLFLSNNKYTPSTLQVGTFAPISNTLITLDLGQNVQLGQFLPCLCTDMPNLIELVYKQTGLTSLDTYNGTCSLNYLNSLDISSNQKLVSISDTSVISQMGKLRSIDVSFTKLKSVAGGVWAAPALNMITMKSTSISTVGSLFNYSASKIFLSDPEIWSCLDFFRIIFGQKTNFSKIFNNTRLKGRPE